MNKIQTPCRYDFVGSFLRPEKLKQARAQFKAGKISQQELDAVTDEAVAQVVTKQKAAGFSVITDGECRRSYWHLDFMWGFEGVAHKAGGGVRLNGEVAELEDTWLVGKVGVKQHPIVE